MSRPQHIPPKTRNGRPTIYDEAIVREILWEIANGMTGTAAARDRGISATTWARWKRGVPGLADRIDEAEAQRWDRQVQRREDESAKRRFIAGWKRDRRVRLNREKRLKGWYGAFARVDGNWRLLVAFGVKMPPEFRQRYRFEQFLELKAMGLYRDADRNNPFPRGARARRTIAEVAKLVFNPEPHVVRRRINPTTGEVTVIYDSWSEQR